MIKVTPEMIGPGIEEEYADAMERIDKLLEIFKGFPGSNDTSEGRMVYELRWLKQEIKAQHLPIPLAEKYRATLAYFVGEGSLDYLPGAESLMGDLNLILEGTGLIKPRHYPAILAMVDEFLTMLRQHQMRLKAGDQEMVAELEQVRNGLLHQTLLLPLESSTYSAWKRAFRENHVEQIPGAGQMQISLNEVLFGGFRPEAVRKGPMPPPKPGLRWGKPS